MKGGFKTVCGNCASDEVRLESRDFETGARIMASCQACKYSAWIQMKKESPDEFLMPYGKYKGTAISVILQKDPDYAAWLANNTELKGRMRDLLGHLKRKENLNIK